MNKYNDRNLSKDSTIYTYTLLKRVRHSLPISCTLWLIALIPLVWDLYRLQPAFFFISFIALPILHVLLITVIGKLKSDQGLRQWRLSFRVPWFGFAPIGYVALSKIFSLHLQVFFITLVVIGCFYPWLPQELLAQLLYLHLWLMLPRLFILWRFRSFRHTAYLIVNSKDTSCYLQ